MADHPGSPMLQQSPTRWRLTTTAVVVAAVLLTAACSAGQPVELNQTRPPATVTVTQGVTRTITQTSPPQTSTTSTPPPATSSPAGPTTTVTFTTGTGRTLTSTFTGRPPRKSISTSTVTVAPGQPATASDPATVTGLGVGYVALVAQIAVLDAAPLSGAPAASSLDALAGQYRALRALPVPKAVDRPSYAGRLYSLELFATAAANEARSGSPQAAARYGVIREQTATLLALVGNGLGVSLTLPPLQPVTPSATTSKTAVAVP